MPKSNRQIYTYFRLEVLVNIIFFVFKCWVCSGGVLLTELGACVVHCVNGSAQSWTISGVKISIHSMQCLLWVTFVVHELYLALDLWDSYPNSYMTLFNKVPTTSYWNIVATRCVWYIQVQYIPMMQMIHHSYDSCSLFHTMLCTKTQIWSTPP